MVQVDTDTLHHQLQQHHQLLQPQQQALPPAAVAAAVLAWVDRTLRYLNNSSAFKDAVLLTVLATPGSIMLPAVPTLLAAGGGEPINPNAVLAQAAAGDVGGSCAASGQQQLQQVQQQHRVVLKPLQSWEQLGGHALAISKQRPMLCLRRLPGVNRRDGCVKFSLQECCSSSGTLGLVADRLLPELAYKLGRAPKYGA